jgi:cytochrome c-type biogenesis protein CcmF
MVVHLGVVVIAVALASATTFGHRTQVTLAPGTSTVVDGHRIGYVSLAVIRTPVRTATEALVLVDGRGPLRPAVSQFGPGTEAVGTPAVESGVLDDVYLTVDSLPPGRSGPVAIGVTVQPLVSWLWVGGAVVVVGAALAALPGRRRRPTEAASAPPDLGRRTGRGRAGAADADGPEPMAAQPPSQEPALPVVR